MGDEIPQSPGGEGMPAVGIVREAQTQAMVGGVGVGVEGQSRIEGGVGEATCFVPIDLGVSGQDQGGVQGEAKRQMIEKTSSATITTASTTTNAPSSSLPIPPTSSFSFKAIISSEAKKESKTATPTYTSLPTNASMPIAKVKAEISVNTQAKQAKSLLEVRIASVCAFTLCVIDSVNGRGMLFRMFSRHSTDRYSCYYEYNCHYSRSDCNRTMQQ